MTNVNKIISEKARKKLEDLLLAGNKEVLTWNAYK